MRQNGDSITITVTGIFSKTSMLQKLDLSPPHNVRKINNVSYLARQSEHSLVKQLPS